MDDKYDATQKVQCPQCHTEIRRSNMSRHLAAHSTAQPRTHRSRSPSISETSSRRSVSSSAQTISDQQYGGLSLESFLVAERAATAITDQHGNYEFHSLMSFINTQFPQIPSYAAPYLIIGAAAGARHAAHVHYIVDASPHTNDNNRMKRALASWSLGLRQFTSPTVPLSSTAAEAIQNVFLVDLMGDTVNQNAASSQITVATPNTTVDPPPTPVVPTTLTALQSLQSTVTPKSNFQSQPTLPNPEFTQLFAGIEAAYNMSLGVDPEADGQRWTPVSFAADDVGEINELQFNGETPSQQHVKTSEHVETSIRLNESNPGDPETSTQSCQPGREANEPSTRQDVVSREQQKTVPPQCDAVPEKTVTAALSRGVNENLKSASTSADDRDSTAVRSSEERRSGRIDDRGAGGPPRQRRREDGSSCRDGRPREREHSGYSCRHKNNLYPYSRRGGYGYGRF